MAYNMIKGIFTVAKAPILFASEIAKVVPGASQTQVLSIVYRLIPHRIALNETIKTTKSAWPTVGSTSPESLMLKVSHLDDAG